MSRKVKKYRYGAPHNLKATYLFNTVLVITLMILCGCTQPIILPSPIGAEARQIIYIQAEAEILHYSRQSFWTDEEFSKILESKGKFESEYVASFQHDLENYDKQVFNGEVIFDKSRKSTTLVCDIEGAMYSADSYDFDWLLGDLPFDLYQFEQSERELDYEGEVNATDTRIRLIFPYPIAHCHEHVWPA